MWRALRFSLAFLLAIAAGVAGASAFVNTTGQDTADGPDAVQPDGNGSALVVSAADPAGRQPWAIRVYRSKAGLTCPEAGRTQDGTFGQVDEQGEFRASSLQAAGSCIDLTKAPLSVTTNDYPANDNRGARSVVFGAVSADVRSVTITVADQVRDLDISGGAYLAVLTAGQVEGAVVNATTDDGSEKSYTLHASKMSAALPPADG